MMSIAVNASVCASASDAARLVASFMPFSLDLGMTHRCARTRLRWSGFLLGIPHDNIRFDESPPSEYWLVSSSTSNEAAFWL
jgi:hypothetical protein